MSEIIELPKPVLDNQELTRIDILTKDYEKFRKPGHLNNLLKSTSASIGKVIPENLKEFVEDLLKGVSEAELMQQALGFVAQGFVEIESRAAQLSINKLSVVKRINNENKSINSYEQICFARGYEIEKSLNLKDLEDLTYAALQGGATGFFGFAGIPANIVMCTFLFFRAVQNIALHYGYDVKDDPNELEIASVITMQALNPTMEANAESLSAVIGKMMLMTQATALRQGLNKSYVEMINKGGIQLLYVQIRALANNAAKSALEKAGKSGLERTVYSEMLEQLGKQMSKSAGKKAVPVLGGLIGMLFDTAYMSRVLKYAKIVYHKRFLLEKEQRMLAVLNREEFSIQEDAVINNS